MLTAVLLIIILFVGFLLGLFGGGGSILLVPVLVYLAGQDPKSAIAMSLLVVGLTSLVAVFGHARCSRVCWKNGAAFGLSGMIGAYCGGRLASYVPGNVLLVVFGLVMLAIAFTMLSQSRDEPDLTGAGPLCPVRINLPAVLFDGFLVGSVTGLVGVGGGFLIVPALNLLGGLPMRAAIGTSLMVVVMNSFAALAAYGHFMTGNLTFSTAIISIAILGSIVGTYASKRLDTRSLRRVFGVFVIALAGYILHREMSWSTLDEVRQMIDTHQEFFRGLLTTTGIMGLYWFRGMVHHRHLAYLDESKP